MAKGDSAKAQKQIDTQIPKMQGAQDYLTQVVTGQNNNFQNSYNQAVNLNARNYDEIMNNYRTFIGQPPGMAQGGAMGSFEQALREYQSAGNPTEGIGGIIRGLAERGIDVKPFVYEDGTVSANEVVAPDGTKYKVLANENSSTPTFYNSSMDDGGGSGQPTAGQFGGYEGYGEFAKTGGFSPQDLQKIRERATSGVRSVYDSANSDIDRQRNLQGGYSPNYTASKAKMARQMSHAIADANVNADASIAQMVQQGRLAGLGGMTGIDQAKAQQALSAMQGQGSLYSATPGQASMFGNQVLNSTGQLINTAQNQNDIGRTAISGQINKAGVPSNFEQGIRNVGNIAKIGTNIATGFASL